MFSASFAKIYRGFFAFFGTIALAVHLYDGDRAGTVKSLDFPPVGCNTSKEKILLSPIGPRNTDQILEKMSS